MKSRVIIGLLPALSLAANLIENPQFFEITPGSPASWQSWSPRAEIRPQFAVVHGGGSHGLAMRSKKFADYGKWMSAPIPVQAGRYYRFAVDYTTDRVADERVSVVALLSWFKGDATGSAIQRDYVDKVEPASERRRLWRTMAAPPNASAVQVELVFRWSDGGSVQWWSPSLSEAPAPAARKVKLAISHIKPKSPYTIESNLALMAKMIDAAAEQKADIVCLSENLAERAAGLSLEKKAHTIPGPITEALGASARRNKIWVVSALVERDGDAIYNTAVLINREGKVAGKYRKVHLPTAEAEDGMTPGSEYPVFDTDFGRIGLIVCWDNWFVEPARILRLKGAEMLLFPLAGDAEDHWDLMSRARAVDNGVYVVSSNTVGGASRIVNPAGEVVAEASGEFALAVADIDLNQEWRTRWLSIGPGYGEGKSLYVQERRPDTYGEILPAKSSR